MLGEGVRYTYLEDKGKIDKAGDAKGLLPYPIFGVSFLACEVRCR